MVWVASAPRERDSSADPAPDQRHDVARQQIARLRAKLLDLAARNPMVSFKHAARARGHVRVVDELPDQVWARLAAGQPLRFRSLPEPPEEPYDELTDDFRLALEQARLTDELFLAALEDPGDDDATVEQIARAERELKDRLRESLGLPKRSARSAGPVEVARHHGIEPSFELPRAGPLAAARHHDGALQTLLFPKDMERRLSGLLVLHRTTLSELGINALHCAMGFLEWYESDDSEKAHHAPLLLLPLALERRLEGGRYRYRASGTGDEPEANLVLAERLAAQDFGFRLPAIDEDSTPEAYFAEVAALVATKRRWRVRRFATVGLFAFPRLAMFKDLEDSRWPDLAAPARHPVLLDLLAGRERAGEDEEFAETYPVDEPPFADEVPLLVTDADSSQHSAIVDVLRGRDLALEGPPGTGKSQTITNLVAAALARGKTVLFVAEKAAALAVVADRLAQADLGPFCLEVHSTKASKKEVLAAVDTRLRLQGRLRGPEQIAARRREVEELKRRLNEHARLVNAPFGALGLTAHDILWRA